MNIVFLETTMSLIVTLSLFVKGEVILQPKIEFRSHGLKISAAQNKDIVFRLLHETEGLYLNTTNILKVVQMGKVLETASPTVNILYIQVKQLTRDVNRLNTRLTTFQTSYRQSRNMRRFLNRVRRLIERVNTVKRYLNSDKCVQNGVNPCKNDGVCFGGYRDFFCDCQQGWTGKSCEEDIDECYIFSGTDMGCQNGAACVNTHGSFSCACVNGYNGMHCTLKTSGCNSSSTNELCNNGMCVVANNEVGYTCICDAGWTKSNVTSTCSIDVNECATGRNPCHKHCINTPGSFKCSPCPKGYSGNGINCIDVNECEESNGGCSIHPKVPCVNTEGSYHCGTCPTGWHGDGRNCELAPSNSCDEDNICHPQAKCEYISDTIVCTCPPYMSGHGFGPSGCKWEFLTNPCEAHDCKNNGTCAIIGNGTRCICPKGYMGALCDQVDACLLNPCRNGGSCRLLANNKFRCTCARGFTGDNCEVIRAICGSIITQESGALSYPSNGTRYEANERCAWAIRTTENKILNVTFSKFDLEGTSECTKDWLQIHDGRSLTSQLIGRFCGNALPLSGRIMSSQQQLFFWFRSDNSSHNTGFELSWTSQEHICGGNLQLNENDNGIIHSPGYPGKTSANRECEWRLNVPFGFRIVLRIYEVTMGRSTNCTGDSLKVYDSNFILKVICTTSMPEPLHTSSNKAIIHFHTDSDQADSSFQLHYEVVPGIPHCGGIFTEPSGIITVYMNAQACRYLIKQPKGLKIKLNFTQFELLNSENCNIQNLEVYDGLSEDDSLLKRICGTHKDIEPIISTNNVLLIRYSFSLSGVNFSKKLELKYSRVCDNKFFGPDPGSIFTPNYPNPYYDHITCNFEIYGPINYNIRISFVDFSITESVPSLEEYDSDIHLSQQEDNLNYLDVYLSNNNKRRFYKSASGDLISQSNRAKIVFHSGKNSLKSRGVHLEYHFERVLCGGILLETAGRIELPSAISTLSTCEWIIEGSEYTNIMLSFTLNCAGTECTSGEDSLQLYSNRSLGSAQLLASFNEDTILSNETFHTNYLTIIYKAKSTSTFWGQYVLTDSSKDCGGNFTTRYGIIKTPSWPKHYAPSMDCIWKISAPGGYQIELIPKNFSLEETNGCIDDYLEIRNGPFLDSPLIGKYCGSSIPARIPSFTNNLYLHFKSDRYVSDTGFYLTWQQTQTGCGGRLNSHKGSIHSPHNANDEVCEWKITVAQGSRINAKLIVELNEYPSSNLCEEISRAVSLFDGLLIDKDRLELNCSYENVYHQKFALNTIKTKTNQMFIRYNMKQNGEILLFSLDYEIDCNVPIGNIQGVIESPNFPEPYPSDMNCIWDIRGRRNNKISIIFSHLDIEKIGNTCEYDYIEVIDMRDEEVLSTSHLCTMPSRNIITEGNRVLLKFISDGTDEKEGFRIEYKRVGCGEYIKSDYGLISSPNAPYSLNMDCDWYIEVLPGYQIILHFSELHIESETKNCDTNYIVVKEDKESEDLMRECQIEQTPVTITSPANRLYIRFITTDIKKRKYFKASFGKRKAKCGGAYRGNSGLISSPRYPYDRFIECIWTINVEMSYGIQLSFQELNITNSANCTNGFIEISKMEENSNYILERVCGSKKPLTKLMHASQLKIKFQTSNELGFDKFILRFEKQCGGELIRSEGYIKSNVDEECKWRFIGTESSKIFIDILTLDCPCGNARNCSNGVTIFKEYDDHESVGICFFHQSNMVFATSILNVVAKNVKFVAKYSTVESSCGGSLTSIRGSIVSPGYPEGYLPNIDCSWEIQIAPGNSVELNIDFLDIATSEFCNQDFLEIRSGNQRNLKGLYCANELPLDTIVAFDRVWIRFRSIGNPSGNGFKVSWNYGHLNELNDTRGSIENPPLHSIRDEEPYNWRIMLQRGKRILLEFTEYRRGLILYDGFDVIAKSIEIPNSPWRYVSGSNVVLLSTNNAELDKFRIFWSEEDNENIKEQELNQECRKNVTLSQGNYVNITSPGYPEGYESNLKCEWLIHAESPAQHAVFRLYYLDLEDFPQCSADYLRVSSSSDLENWQEELMLCNRTDKAGGMRLINEVHGTPYLKIEFVSDPGVNGTGFYSKVSTACGSNMTGSIGSISNSQELFPKLINLTCIWHVRVSPGKRISIDFKFSETLNKNLSCDQYALIYDGIDEGSPILKPGRICNAENHKIRQLQSSSNQIIIKYNLYWKTGADIMDIWNLTFREYSDCGGEVRLTNEFSSVNISSPRYPNLPQPYAECTWIIIGPVGETLQANFIDHFDMNLRYCNKEYIEVLDGSTSLAPSLGKFCTKPNSIQTTTNVMSLYYISNIPEPRSGFRVNISIGVCGGTYNSPSSEITSNNYPIHGAYPKMTTCEYFIKLPTTARMRLNFTDIDLPFISSNLNLSDRIEVIPQGLSASSDDILTIYGNVTNFPLIDFDTNELLIRFVTFNGNKNYRGFSVKYVRLFGICFQSVNGLSGVVSLNNQRRPGVFKSCRWKITVPKGQRVRLEFQRIQISTSSNTTLRTSYTNSVSSNRPIIFTFYNDPDMQSKIIELDVFALNNQKVIKSTDNIMFVYIQLGKQVDTVGNIRARYFSDEQSLCPADISDSRSGEISIKALQTLSSYFCRIQFINNDEETITFTFDELSIIQNTSTSFAYAIRIRNDVSLTPYALLNSNNSNRFVSISEKRGSLFILQNNNIRILNLMLNYRRHACGGVIVLTNGFTLTNPNLDEDNYGFIECAWNLRKRYVSEGYVLTGITTFKNSCDREYIAFYTSLMKERMKFCRDIPFDNFTLTTMNTYLVYHSEDYHPEKSEFHLLAQKRLTCGSKLYVNSESTAVVINSESYNNSMECSWEYETSEGLYLSVVFSDHFFIEDSIECTKDYLEIQRRENNLWISEARFCGRDIPNMHNTTSNNILIIFRTNEAITGDGFKFRVAVNCYITFNVTEQKQILPSPRFLNLHKRKIHCEYTFTSKSDNMISVRIMDDVTVPFRCSLTKFTIYKRDEVGNKINVGEYCMDVQARSRQIIQIEYDSSIERNFKIEYQLDVCGGNITEPTTIRSLFKEHGETYIMNMNCQWNIIAPLYHSIIIRFKYFEMEYQSNCKYDFLIVYKGLVGSSEKTTLCGNFTSNPPEIMIDGYHAVIKAVTDGSGEHKGFLANVIFSENCNEKIELFEGNSPVALLRNFKLNITTHKICHYSVKAPKYHRVSIYLKKIQFTNSPNCRVYNCDQCNFIEIVDSAQAKYTSLGTYCTNSSQDVKLLSSFEDALIKLNIFEVGNYAFEINLENFENECGVRTEIEIGENEVEEIRYPFNASTSYPPHSHCKWLLKSAQEFEIKFTRVDLQGVSQVTGKCLDYVHIKANFMSKYFCGNATGFRVFIPKIRDSYAEITFHSDDSDENRGIILTARQVQFCNRTYTEPSGILHYNPVDSKYFECIDRIEIPYNYTISLYMQGIIFRIGSCNKVGLQITDIQSNKTLYKACSDTYENLDILTNTNSLIVHAKEVSSLQIFYVATPKNLTPGCGGKIHDTQGFIMNPFYNDHNSSNCQWEINVPPGNTIRLQFPSFNMGSSINCALDFVNIYELLDDNLEKLVQSLCGQDIPDDFIVESHRIKVNAQKSSNFDGVGWSIRFTINQSDDEWSLPGGIAF